MSNYSFLKQYFLTLKHELAFIGIFILGLIMVAWPIVLVLKTDNIWWFLGYIEFILVAPIFFMEDPVFADNKKWTVNNDNYKSKLRKNDCT